MVLKIGHVAQTTGLSVEAIRYYERLGLIDEATRTPSGYRQFEPDVVRRLRFVQRAQALGFSLEEIRELLDLRLSAAASAAEVREKADAKLSEIEVKLSDLRRMRRALKELTRSCCGDGSTSDCPILDALEGPEAR
ncbi:MAG: heavy metal-responsive transcriptional regulator [Thermoanaerobaculia bacterium]